MERVIFDTDLYIDWLQQRRLGYDLKKRTRLVNDCLIALSSRQIGATVFTHNARDFEAIRRLTPFKLVVVL